MEPFPPELIAKIATKLYQQGPHESSAPHEVAAARGAMPSQATHLSPPLPSSAMHGSSMHGGLPEVPSAFGSEQLPSHHNTLRHDAMNHDAFQRVSANHLPATPSLPSTPSLPHAAPMPTMNSFADSQSRAPLAFRNLNSGQQASGPSSVSGQTDDGLSRFVAQVRNQAPAKRENCLDHDQMRFRQVAGQAANSTAHQRQGSGNFTQSSAPLDVNRIRDDFPILHQKIHGHPLAWLDNAATTQKPQVVIDAISRFYETDNSNIHRGAHSLAARATDAYESARETVARFIGAGSSKDIVFARGTTEAINLVANTYGARYLKKGDEILLSMVEHHANIVPWQMIAKRKGAVIRVIPINDRGEIMMDEYLRLLSPRTRIVSLTHASNSLGSILPVAEMTHLAKRYGARVLIDGAQSISHMPINVQAIGCDFFVFSGHKIFGPTGVGSLYVTEELHDVLPPWQGGGNMIKNVTFEKTTYSDAPAKFEAGTPNIADAVGLKAALDYVTSIGLSSIAAHEHALLANATEQLSRIAGLRILGTAQEKVSVISFVMEGRSTEEVGKALDHAGIAVRSGHHCAQPSLRRFGVESTVRPSFSIYNTHSEVDRLAKVVHAISRQ